MSKFSSYARKADALAREALSKLVEAENALKEAEAQARKFPIRSGGRVDLEYQAKSTRAAADVLTAKEELKMAQRSMGDYTRQINAVRQELRSALESEYIADPSAIDANTMTLLQSGILRPTEYIGLMNQAREAGNHTMARLIGKHADAAATELEKQFPLGHPGNQRVQELRAVALQGNTDPTSDKLAAFDVIGEAFSRSTMNTAMIDSWDLMTSSILEEF